MTKVSELQMTAAGWGKYHHRPAVSVSACCLLLMGLKPAAAKKAGVTRWPTKLKLGRRYNALLAQAHSGMAGKNPLLQPLEGQATRDRDEFQKLLIPLAYFVALATSDVTPFSTILQQEPPDAFKRLAPPVPTGYGRPDELLNELRETYVKSNDGVARTAAPEDTEFDEAAELSKIKSRHEKQVLLYCGVLLHWVHETYMGKDWLSRPKPSLNAIEAVILPWLEKRVTDLRQVPSDGTMRKSLRLALEAFRQSDIELEPLPTSSLKGS